MKSLDVGLENTWLVLRDFNEILKSREKWGGIPRQGESVEDVKRTVAQCNLLDLGLFGPKFTWCNNREREACISEMIDWFLANNRWR